MVAKRLGYYTMERKAQSRLWEDRNGNVIAWGWHKGAIYLAYLPHIV